MSWLGRIWNAWRPKKRVNWGPMSPEDMHRMTAFEEAEGFDLRHWNVSQPTYAGERGCVEGERIEFDGGALVVRNGRWQFEARGVA